MVYKSMPSLAAAARQSFRAGPADFISFAGSSAAFSLLFS
jgi:hypothetical protein